jgi:ATP-dependent DNA helicase RecG
MEVKLDQVKGIGPQTLRLLRNQGIWNTYDLVLNTPKSYEDFSFTSIYDLKDKTSVTIQGKIVTAIKVNRYTKAEVTSFRIEFMHQEINIVAFGKGFLAKTFQQGDMVVVKGVYQLFKNQIVASSVIKPEKKVDIKPIYHIEGLHDANISTMVSNVFQDSQVQIFENIPKVYLDKYQLVGRQDAFYRLHFPKDERDIEQACRRLKYEEAFFLHLKLALRQPSLFKRPPKAYDIHKVRDFIQQIPYELTQDQKDAVNEIYRDFKQPFSSYRLIQGDVGSGKTIVSMIASYAVITSGEQVTLMAPTEMLANQHYQSFKTLMNNVNIALLTSKTKNKDQVKEDIKNHKYDLVIGTQALIESDVVFDNLGLIIIDEQHKFGVHTRDELISKANAKDILYLTATPIPRTLAMAAFGEHHVSLIKQKPKERAKVETVYLTKDKVNDLYEAIKQTVSRKEHVFVVVPAISSTKVDDNIETAHQELKERLNAPIFVLHSKLAKDVQEEMMHQFIYTPGSILLATTMIEVGIDIPTATLMAIFSAEHFGLSQLHQLRGRIGRSSLKSRCFLISEKEDIERLNILSTEHDGFKLSEYDLIERGPGDFLGKDQSGYFEFRYLNLLSDAAILQEASKNVSELISQKDFMTNPKYKYLNRYLKDDKLMI